jgi:tetratricopeptide (TPR) repeat protein
MKIPLFLLPLPIAAGFFLINPLKSTPSPYQYPFSQIPTNTTSSLQREIAFYKQRLNKSPDSPLNKTSLARAYLKMARATGQNSWYLLAEETAKESLSLLSFHNNGAILTLARTAQARHDFTKALDLANQVLKSEPNNEDALAVLVTANVAQGKLEDGKKAADQLVNKIPSQGSFTLLALVLTAQGKEKEALDTFKYALSAEEPGEIGTSAWTRTLLGQFYYKRGQIKEAEEVYKEALKILPKYQLALVHLGELETRKGDYRAALNYFDKVRVYSPDSSTIFDHAVLRGKAKLKKLQGNSGEAIALYQQAETLLRQENSGNSIGNNLSKNNPNNSASFGHRRELARLLLERGNGNDIPEAVSLMETEVTIRRDAQTLDTYAWALLGVGKNQEAKKIIGEAIALGTKDATIFHRAAMIENSLGNQTQMVTYQKLAKEIDPTFVEEIQRNSGLDDFSF